VITATSLVDETLGTIRRHGLLRGGEVVLTAVSGGADSVALLDVLCALRATLRLDLVALHVHHGLRPGADADADFVRDLCARLGVSFRCERVEVRREAVLAADWGGPRPPPGACATPPSAPRRHRRSVRVPPLTPPTTRPRPC
jgi:tRNA(Ile)-lysidine synthase TilS/MesJ